MPYPTNGVNYSSPGYNPYIPNYTYPAPVTYPFAPANIPAQQPTVSQQTYAPQVAPVRGRVVKSETDISPSDVPMDSYSSYFPLEDASCIYVKYWDKDGKIQTTKFVPVNDASDVVSTASFEDEMRERFDTIERLVKQRNAYKPKYHKPQPKQDGDANA